jgi:hypothetical protein
MFSDEDGTVSPLDARSQTPSLTSGGSTHDSAVDTATATDSLTAPEPGNRSKFKEAFGRLSPKRLSRFRSRSRSPASSEPSLPLSQAPTETPSHTSAQRDNAFTNRPPIPDIRVEGESLAPLSMQDEESQRLRTEARWWTMVKWADHNKGALEAEINRLTGSVTAFRQYLEIRELRNPGRILAVDSSIVRDSYVPRMPPNAVRELHDALKSINSGPTMFASFSLSISESCDSNRRAIEGCPGLQEIMNPGSKMFFLQKEAIVNAEESTFVAIEQCDVPAPGLQRHEPVTCVDAMKPREQSFCISGYSSCGLIESKPPGSAFHHVLVETNSWRISSSFADYLDEERIRRLLTPVTLVDIFRTLLTAYLDLEKIRESCRYPRIEDYKTYVHPEYSADQTVASASVDTSWQMPYWACGLGTPLPRRIPGASREEREPDEAVIRLGLVLFQLGSSSKSIMAPGSSGLPKPWRNLKLEALNRFEEVSRLCGSVLANIVQTCLLANAQTEKEAVCSCLISLENLRTELGNAA